MATQSTIYEQLKQDHKRVMQILDEMVSSKETQKAKREQLLGKLRPELLAHAHVEEKLLYSELEQHQESKDIALEGEEEHHVAEALLKELESTDAGDEHWEAKATVLKELMSHHIEEEEQQMFPKAKKVLDDAQEIQLGQQFRQQKQQEMQRL